MKLPPYSLEEAKQIREDYTHIVGMSWDGDAATPVDMVVITPFDENSMNRFLMLYVMLNDADAALSMDYAGSKFDVSVITGSATAAGVKHLSLYKWLAAKDKELRRATIIACTGKVSV